MTAAVQLDIVDAAEEANRPRLRIGSLCTGYGGLTAAVQEVLGGDVAWHADNAPEAAALLAHHHPGIPNLGDLTAVDWSQVLAEHGPVDVLEGGYPCQPFSLSGLRKGTDDERHIWPHIARAVDVLRPGLVYLENVSAHLTLGFADVLAGLARLGFDAQWTSLRASDVGAAHQRNRLFVLAWPRHPDRVAGTPRSALRRQPGPLDRPRPVERAVGPDRAPVPDADGLAVRQQPVAQPRGRGPSFAEHPGAAPADADSDRREGVQRQQPGVGARDDADGRGEVGVTTLEWGPYATAIHRWEHVTGRTAPVPAEPAPRGGRRLSPPFVEWLMGLPAGHVTAAPGLTHPAQLRLLGNGVVPQQAAHALRLLLDRAPEALAALPALDPARSS